jgi:glycerol-3-phosphate acyltransferase PlsY
MVFLYIIPEVLAAYLIGSIASALWVGKLFYGIDIRQHGSGNAGATNVIRVFGYKAGIPVMLFDVFKGWLAVQLATWVNPGGLEGDMLVYLRVAMGISAVVGHVFPVFAGFRGGKGVGTFAGVGIALFPLALLIVLAIFIVVLVLTHYVSLSSIIGSLAFPLIVIFITHESNPALLALSLMVALFIPWTHRKNIRRLLKGEENKFVFKPGKKERV